MKPTPCVHLRAAGCFHCSLSSFSRPPALTHHHPPSLRSFPEGILGHEICDKFRAQSARFGTQIFSETVTRVDLSRRPFTVLTDEKEVTAETVIIATGAVARRLAFTGSDEGAGGFWNKGISACAVCDGAAPMFRGRPIAVIGGGDSAMEEASAAASLRRQSKRETATQLGCN